MIRAICLILLLANVGYFAWHAWIVPSPSASPAPPRSAMPLVLAREAPPPATAPESLGVASDGSRCVSVGPFVDITEAAKAAVALRSNGYAPRQRALDGTVWAGYWVALDQIPSAQEADAILIRLRKSGIADSYVMPAGGGSSITISLGLFTERQRALTRVDEIRALGFEPRINTRQRTGTVYWIDVDVDGGPTRLDFARFESDAGRILRLEVKDCAAAQAVDGGGVDAAGSG